MLIVVDKVLPTLLKGSTVDACVLPNLRGIRHPYWSRQGLWREAILGALAIAPGRLNLLALDFALGVEGRAGRGFGTPQSRYGKVTAPLAEETGERTPGGTAQGPAEPP